ncbi:MAG: lytic transglycosylase domain-containing protein [Deltaproteobacteria bacterium]|nr:lytic transglycosylase domain-containing protein [Deltaproteobacteria bacterium]
MDKRWVHPLFKPSRRTVRDACLFVGKGNFVSSNKHPCELIAYVPFSQSIQAVGGFGHLNKNRAGSVLSKRLTIFVVSAIIAITFSVSAIFLKTKFTYSPRIAGLELAEFKLNHPAPIDKQTFLARLSVESKRQLSSQVHYVSQLINNPKLSHAEAKKLASMIVLESARSGYDPLFVTAVIKSESTFNRHAVSYAGATGLMQIMPDTGKFVARMLKTEWKGVHKLRDPEYNIRLGIAYLKHLEEVFEGNRELMLIAYNWGPQNVIDALRNEKRVPRSCIRYAKTIINNHGRWNASFLNSMAQFKYLDLELIS